MPVCPICSNVAVHQLPVPHPDQAMISDGRVVPFRLSKTLCETCGSAFHSELLKEENVRDIYNHEYDLALDVSPTDLERNSEYAELIAELQGPEAPKAVLEIGCGSGHVLTTLSRKWPASRYLGLEAAESLANHTQNITPDNIDVTWAFVEDLVPQSKPFDLIFSINVLEHAHSPQDFLAACRKHLAPQGRVIIICPSASPPNLELMFLDHIHTFSKNALLHLAQDAGLQIDRHHNTLPNGGAFQIAILSHAKGNSTKVATFPPSQQSKDELDAYLRSWANLDDRLLQRLAAYPQVSAMGAGEMAALLRAYAPRTWARIETLYADNPDGARDLDRPVKPLAERPACNENCLLIATHPGSQAMLASTLTAQGIPNVSFHDLLSR